MNSKESLELVVGTSDFCRNFPRRPSKTISRDNLYDYVESILKETARCVLIESEVQGGKTEFLAGYMHRHPQNSIGVFLSPGDSYFYSPEYARLVPGEQIHWILNGKSASFDSLDSVEYKRMLFRLQKHAKQQPITFVLDGLVGKSSPEARLKSEILDLLPFGQQDFRFLISCSGDIDSDIRAKCKSIKSIPLIPIAQEEATEFFSDISGLTGKDISDIKKFCGNSIGRMTKFKAIIKGGSISLDEIFSGNTGELDDLMDIEWESINADEDKAVLAYLCYSNRPLTTDDIKRFTHFDLSNIKIFCQKTSFAAYDTETDYISVNSDLERKYLRQKLSMYENEVNQNLMDDLLARSESIEADRHLPSQLLQMGKYDELFSKLNTDHFCRLLNNEKSLRALRANFELGLKAAREYNNESLISIYGMGKSIVSGLTFSVGSQRRIEALISMGDTEQAIEISSSAATREERLKLLASTAKSLFSERKTIPQVLKEEIKLLLDEITPENLGSLAIPIACDLIVVDLEAAVSLFNSANALVSRRDIPESTSPNNPGTSNSINIDADLYKSSELEIRMSEQYHKRFAAVLGQMVDRTPADKICTRIQQSSDITSDLWFVKEWIGRRRSDPGAYSVASAALDAILKDLTRSPRIEDLRAISLVIPHTQNLDEVEKLSKRIQTQLTSEFFLGSSTEGIRLRMLLAEAEYRLRPCDAELTLLEILVNIEDQNDISIRAACLSWMLHALKQFPECDSLEEKTSLISHATNSLMHSLEELLANSADHFAATKTALPALARADTELAIRICRSLNTESRRDSAYALLLAELISLKKYAGNPKYILQCAESIEDENSRSTAILSTLYQIEEHLKSDQANGCNEAVQSLWKRLRVANYRFIALRHSLQIEMLLSAEPAKMDILKRELTECWSNIDIDWVRWDLGYSLVRNIFSHDRELAITWLQKITKEEQSITAPSEALSDVLKLTASLAVRAYSYIAIESEVESEDLAKIKDLIHAIAVTDERLQLWCELGIRLHFSGKQQTSKYIFKKFVEPMLPSLENDFQRFSDEITISLAAPFLYITHEASGQLLVDKISASARRDSAIASICFTLLRKVADTDSYKDPGIDGHEIDATTAASIISLIGKLSTDWVIFNVLEAFTNALSAKKNERKFRRNQVAEFLTSLEGICRNRLPDQKNIAHQGFLISSLAHIYKARQAIGLQIPASVWKNLYTEARKLSNVSDRAVVTAFVAAGAKAKINLIPEDWQIQIKSDVDSCPTILDRIDRCAWLAEIIGDCDKKGSLSLARYGMKLTNDADPEVNVYERKQRLLDIVYNIDPDLAEDFIELADRDRARKNDRTALESRIKLQKLQREMAADPEKIDLAEKSEKDISEISIRNLGALNANRISPRPIEDFKRLLTRAPSLPFESAYCVWSWILENSIRKGGANSKGEKMVFNIFKSSTKSGELLISLLHGTTNILGARGIQNSGIIGPGDRATAVGRILEWAKSVDGETIIISDPFFGPDEVDLLFEISKVAPKSPMRILTGRRHVKKSIPDGNFEDTFANAWRDVCDASSSDIEIAIIGVNNDGDHPVHDRWFVAENSGLRLGTSANSLGVSRISELSPIENNEIEGHKELLIGFLNRKTRFWEGIRISLSNFYLL
ncbi:hypothetical protein ACIGHN_08035 [Acidovorax sp. NPDC077693]|uniref:hypothetical protein n=1 Tax=unclassified Acidovorax TaxID=2684926 RepID=UPI0037CA937E